MSRFLKTKSVTQEYSAMSPKKFRPDGSGPSSLTNRVEELKSLFDNRLNAMEKKMDLLITACSSVLSNRGDDSTDYFGKNENHVCCATLLLPKIMVIEEVIKNALLGNDSFKSSLNESGPVVLIPSGKPPVRETTSTDQVISLNSENDLPDGSWLGDENDPKGRVRVNISPANLIHMNERCQTPEKMALALLDYLFPRDIQAISNISGKGKHCKRQLDPLKIFAIRCHLVHKFSITEQDWYRIKQNINAKCRSVWRKKVGGLPLETNNKIDSEPNFPPSDLNQSTDIDSDDSFNPMQGLDDSSNKSILDNELRLASLQGEQSLKMFAGEDLESIILNKTNDMVSISPDNNFLTNQIQINANDTTPINELPDISWVNDEIDPKEQVSVNIPQSVLDVVNDKCHTPEKMALTLLDYFFPREVQATSNISGKGIGKIQLDPEKISAIKSHLDQKFNITEQDWYRIKQNINSKCRTIWRKKINGLPLGSNKTLNYPTKDINHFSDFDSDDSFNPANLPDDSSNNSILGQAVKVFTDEEIKDFLHGSWTDEPTVVGEFQVDEVGCFTLIDQKLLSNGGDSLDKTLETGNNPLLSSSCVADFASEKPDK